MIRLLLEEGADVRCQDVEGWATLHVALRTLIIKHTIYRGTITLLPMEQNGFHVLPLAEVDEKVQIMALLLEWGASTTAWDSSDKTPRALAAKHLNLAVRRSFKEHKSSTWKVVSKDQFGLMWSQERQQYRGFSGSDAGADFLRSKRQEIGGLRMSVLLMLF